MREDSRQGFSTNQQGLTLIELLLAVTILMLVLGIGVSLYFQQVTVYSRGEARSDVRQNVALAAGFVTDELRYATHVRIYDASDDDYSEIQAGNFSTPFAVFETDDSDDYNFIYFDDAGHFIFREAGGEPVIKYEAIALAEEFDPEAGAAARRVVLSLDFNFAEGVDNDTPPVNLHFSIKNSATDDYSIKTTIGFLNTIQAWLPGNTESGLAIAYKGERPPPQEGCIPVYNEEDLLKVGRGTATFSDGITYNATKDACYMQMADINVAGIDNWDPIGSTAEPFTGIYNGQNYQIQNLKIERNLSSGTAENQGLFGLAEGAELRDIHLRDVDVLAFKQVGSLAGRISESTTVENCSATGEVQGPLANAQNIGGLVGLAEGSQISGSSFNGVVQSDNGDQVGGLLGSGTGDSKIYRSYAKGSVTGEDRTGGLVGHTADLEIEESFSRAAVAGRNHCGGLVGWLHTNSKVENSYATGAVSGNNEVGGLVGRHYTNSEIINSYAIGEVTGGVNHIGGLVGRVSSSTVQNSYYDSQTTVQDDDTGKGTPKETGDMVKEATFTPAWDFNTVWSIVEGETYPCLRWHSNTIDCPPADFGLVYYVDSDGKMVSMPFSNTIDLVAINESENTDWVQLIIRSGVGEQTAQDFEFRAPEGVIIEQGVQLESTHAQGFIKIDGGTGDVVIEAGAELKTTSNANNEKEEIYLKTTGSIDIQGARLEARRYIYLEAGENINAQGADLVVTHNSSPNVDINFELNPEGGTIYIEDLFIKFTNVNKNAKAKPFNSLSGNLRAGSDEIEAR